MMTRHSQTNYFILNPDVDHTSGAAINATLYDDTTTIPRLAIGAGLFYNPVSGSGNHTEINAAPGSARERRRIVATG